MPGPESAPNAKLLVCRPTSAIEPTQLVLHPHGGGMIGGHTRTTIAEVLDWAEALELTVAAVDYRLGDDAAGGPSLRFGCSQVCSHSRPVGRSHPRDPKTDAAEHDVALALVDDAELFRLEGVLRSRRRRREAGARAARTGHGGDPCRPGTRVRAGLAQYHARLARCELTVRRAHDDAGELIDNSLALQSPADTPQRRPVSRSSAGSSPDASTQSWPGGRGRRKRHAPETILGVGLPFAHQPS